MCGLQIFEKPCYVNHNCAYIPAHYLICASDILWALESVAVDNPDAVETQVWRNYCLAIKPFLPLLKIHISCKKFWGIFHVKNSRHPSEYHLSSDVNKNITVLSPLAGLATRSPSRPSPCWQLYVKASPKFCWMVSKVKVVQQSLFLISMNRETFKISWKLSLSATSLFLQEQSGVV